MSAYQLSDINRGIREDPGTFVREADTLLRQSVTVAVNDIRSHMEECPIVLLSGPSGSGKTTTAKKIEEELDRQGIETHTVSLDNYFLDFDPETSPRTADGTPDFESPDCLDMALLNRHFTELAAGREIQIPRFVFTEQKRSSDEWEPLRLKKNEIAIFEGIHALNDMITDTHPEAFKLFISVSSHIERNGEMFFASQWMRLMRRIVRDHNFRGADAQFTISLWPNIMRGERLYIDPYARKANAAIDSMLPYEISLLKPYAEPLLRAVPADSQSRGVIEKVLAALEEFETLDASYVSRFSLLREFIGGGVYGE